MFESIINFFKKIGKQEKETVKSKDAAKERLHLVLMQDRANVSADFLDLMKQEIIEVIKKYIDVDENAIDVRLTNKTNVDGTNGAPALYANIPIVSIKEDIKRVAKPNEPIEEKIEENTEVAKKIEAEQIQLQNCKTEQNIEEIKQIEEQNEQKAYENVAEVNNANQNEQKTYENAAEVNNANQSEQKAYENVDEVNRTQEEPVKKEIQGPTENREQIIGNYTRTF